MFHYVQETSMQLLERLRRVSERCRKKYVLIEEDEAYVTPSHTLSKMEKKKCFQSNTMKLMSAHDEKTLDTAVAMANEITTKSMNDLDGDKLPSSPNDRTKFHFKFPHLHLHNNQVCELDKGALGRHAERRNFSEEANSVPDIQSTITEESKLAYSSLIEHPARPPLLPQKPSTIPKPAPRCHDSRAFLSLHKPIRSLVDISHGSRALESLQKPIRRPLSAENTDLITTSTINPLPLPPRSSKSKLVDMPRHIRKYPLKLPPPEVKRPIIYQNALTSLAGPPLPPKNGVDVCDGLAKAATNPFIHKFVNPFDCYLEDVDYGGIDYNVGSDNDVENEEGGLIKDCSDHVSVEDLLEFADQKPCGRQRGVESDEVRIMSKVLKEVTSEQCLQALELSDWNVHLAIKVVRVRDSANCDASLAECAAELSLAGGDVAKAATLLTNKQQ